MNFMALTLGSILTLAPLFGYSIGIDHSKSYPQHIQKTPEAVEDWLLEQVTKGKRDIVESQIVVPAFTDNFVYKAIVACESAQVDHDLNASGTIPTSFANTSPIKFDLILKGCRLGRFVEALDSVLALSQTPNVTRDRVLNLKNQILANHKSDQVLAVAKALISKAWGNLNKTQAIASRPISNDLNSANVDLALNTLLAQALFQKNLSALLPAEIIRIVRISQGLNKSFLSHISGAYDSAPPQPLVKKHSIILKVIQLLGNDQFILPADSAAIDSYIAFVLEK